jgi:antitoxin PrlF
MVRATVTTKGQVTIPKEIRNNAMIESGTQVDFQLQKDGKIILTPIQNDISELKGIVKSRKKKPVSLAEMKKAIGEGAME